MALDKELLEILACPKSKAPLIWFEAEQFLFCPASRLKYPVRDGIPVMLVDEADEVDEAESARLVGEAKKRKLQNA